MDTPEKFTDDPELGLRTIFFLVSRDSDEAEFRFPRAGVELVLPREQITQIFSRVICLVSVNMIDLIPRFRRMYDLVQVLSLGVEITLFVYRPLEIAIRIPAPIFGIEEKGMLRRDNDRSTSDYSGHLHTD